MRIAESTTRVTQGKVYLFNSDTGKITDDYGSPMRPYMKKKYWERCDELSGLAGSDEDWVMNLNVYQHYCLNTLVNNRRNKI